MWEISVISRGEFQFLKPLEPHMTVGGSDACDIVLPDLPQMVCAIFEFQHDDKVILQALPGFVFLNGKEFKGDTLLKEYDICDLSHYRLQLFKRYSPTVHQHSLSDEITFNKEEPATLITFFTPQIKTFTQTKIKIGRGPENDLQFPGLHQVSREHAQIFFKEDGYWIRDLSSKHGTYYYDYLIKERKLPPRGVLRLGTFVLPYQITKYHEERGDTYIVPTASSQLMPQQVVGKSPVIKDFIAKLQQVAPSEKAVLLSGEPGTGKRLSAFLLHQIHPERKNGPFVMLDCATIPQHLLHSQLFGHQHHAFAGATTSEPGVFQKAEKGTLFLQQVDSLPYEIQELISKALENKLIQPLGSSQELPTDVRVIISKDHDRESSSKLDRLSPRLLKVCHWKWRLPALQERIEDIPLLVRYFLQRSLCGLTLEADVIPFLRKFPWPSNIVELSAVLDKAIVYAKFRGSDTISLEDVHLNIPSKANIEHSREIEKYQLLQALEKNHGRISKVVQELNWGRATVFRKIKQYKIDPKFFRKKRA